MRGIAVEVAEAVCTFLREDFAEIPVEREYSPNIELSKPGELRLVVVPREVKRKLAARNIRQCEITVDLAVLKKIDGKTPAEIDPVMALVERIALAIDGRDFFVASHTGGNPLTLVRCESVENSPIFVDRWIDSLRQFASLLVLKMIVFERVE